MLRTNISENFQKIIMNKFIKNIIYPNIITSLFGLFKIFLSWYLNRREMDFIHLKNRYLTRILSCLNLQKSPSWQVCWLRWPHVLVILKTQKTTVATIIYSIRRFQFLKLLVAAAQLQINNIRDGADTKKPGISRFFHFRFTLTHMHSRFPAKSAAPCPRHCDWD